MKPCIAFTQAIQLTPWGAISPCCWYKHRIPYKPGFKFTSLKNIFENDIEKMRQGNWPIGCIDCKTAEENNTRSRRHYLEKQGKIFTSQSIKIYDINLGNFCNLRCRMCNPGNSTGWFQERPGTAYDATDDTINDLVYSITKSTETGTVYIELKGGETFLMPSVEKFIDKLSIINNTKNVHISLSTNGTRFPSWSDKLKLFETDISVSIDGFKETHNYIRGPESDYETILENAKKLKEICYTDIHATITNYNVHEFAEFKPWIENELGMKLNYGFNFDIPHLGAWVLPNKVKENIISKYLDTEFKDIVDVVKKPCSSDLLDKFYTFTEELDKTREQTLKEICPHLI